MRDSPPGKHDYGQSAATSSDKPEYVRLSINLAPADADKLNGYIKDKGGTATDAIRRAIRMLTYISNAQERGASINIYENGNLREVQFDV
ncbi:MAG: hypothetical protein WBQ71_17405 [Trebonia sp.]|jgi:hypothetical protein